MQLSGTKYHDFNWPDVKRLVSSQALKIFDQLDHTLLKDANRQDEAIEHFYKLLSLQMNQFFLNAQEKYTVTDIKFANNFDLASELVENIINYPGLYKSYVFNRIIAAKNIDEFKKHWYTNVGNWLSDLRAKVDSKNIDLEDGKKIAPNRMYQLRRTIQMINAIKIIFENWKDNIAQVSAILGVPVDIENPPKVIFSTSNLNLFRAEWVYNYSATHAQYSTKGKPGPFHTNSNKMALPKNHLKHIQGLISQLAISQVNTKDLFKELAEIRKNIIDGKSDFNREASWLTDISDDNSSENSEEETEINDELMDEEIENNDVLMDYEPFNDELMNDEPVENVFFYSKVFQELTHNILNGFDFPIKLAIYRQLTGPKNNSYPIEWLDKESGEIPTVSKLCKLTNLSQSDFEARVKESILTLKNQIISSAKGI